MRVATGLGAESEPTAEGGGVPGLGSDALARLLDALPIGVGLQDPEGRFFWVNPVLVRQLGMPCRRLAGKHPRRTLSQMADFQQTHQLFIHFPRFLVVVADAVPDVPIDVHVRKQGEILKHIADPTLAGRNEYFAGRIKKHFAVVDDSAAIRLQ